MYKSTFTKLVNNVIALLLPMFHIISWINLKKIAGISKEYLKVITIVSLLFYSTCSNANPKEKEIFEGWPTEAGKNFGSPFTTDAKYALLIGATITGLIVATKLSDPTQEEAVEGKPLGKFSKIGDYGGKGVTNGAYALGMLAHGLLNSDNESSRNSLGMIQSTFYSYLITFHAKYIFNEERPSSKKQSDFPGHEERDSFPSSHATTAFSFASYVGCRHSIGWGIAAYTLATFTAYTRMNDNRHYLHDVTAGATIGTTYGLGVCLSENKQKEELDTRGNVQWFVLPSSNGAISGVTINF